MGSVPTREENEPVSQANMVSWTYLVLPLSLNRRTRGEEDERATEYSAIRPPRSDFTLTTSDLRTPITNSSYRMGPPSSQAHSSVSIITFSYLNLFLTDVRLLHYSPLYGWLFHDRPTLNPMCCLCHHPPRPAHERTRIHPNVWYFAYVSSSRFCTDKYFRFIVAGFLGHFLLYYDV